jgi:hypothetical protein
LFEQVDRLTALLHSILYPALTLARSHTRSELRELCTDLGLDYSTCVDKVRRGT